MRPNNPVSVGACQCGEGKDLLLIAGPCVLQSETSPDIALELKRIVEELAKEDYRVQLVFKGSFDKANRTSASSWRGPGIDAGLELLAEIREKTGLPVTTDVHETIQAERVAQVVDLIQIPAFLARQTDLLAAAAKTGKPVHVKKGQFMAPQDMGRVVEKLLAFGCSDVLLGERGTFFGYGNLVNDFRSLVIMRSFGVPVVFDATHSVQQPSAGNGVSGGKREFVAPLARAAAAVGIDALFLETHFDPEQSPSDGPNMIPIDQVPELLKTILRIRKAVDAR
ncbi:MAG: 3-deoxy-8-phosphooctulonate synthase [Thermoguttaceae bacterium]|nr:3-deoxy-8-phosphooctulonate synthase [Thermoguttaceae bacterium]MBR4751350.1 3-deoxy-8-phosphooctulonate synthase [Thermoguttaceae bacterium]MBR5757809.1 3-deoxy-8-phosphooctulonate synthase [Thermoguttaceae bacterium]